jgi:hypothetical protein
MTVIDILKLLISVSKVSNDGRVDLMIDNRPVTIWHPNPSVLRGEGFVYIRSYELEFE